jgi:Transposase DDE domain group 1
MRRGRQITSRFYHLPLLAINKSARPGSEGAWGASRPRKFRAHQAVSSLRGNLDGTALAYNLGNFLRTLATPEPINHWSLTTLKDNLIKIGAKVVSHGRYIIFQMTRSASLGKCSKRFCSSSRSYGRRRSMSCIQEQPTAGARRNARENGQIRPSTSRVTRGAGSGQHLASVLQEGWENANIDAGWRFIWRISV